MKKYFINKTALMILLLITILSVCSGCLNSERKETEYKGRNKNFVKGADVSWLPQMEKSGFKFYDESGNEKECLDILKEHGINSIRLRTWVMPSEDAVNGHCSMDETVAMAVRAKEKGFRVMIDFHYSDSWSDPGKQRKPKNWENYTSLELQDAVYNYTYEVMNKLKKNGVIPEWVQVGNEINSGMLLPEGSSQNMPEFVKFINRGYDAVKEVSASTEVILHIANGENREIGKWFFDGVSKEGAKFDIIGLSYYPCWENKSYSENIDELYQNMKYLAERYNKEVIIVETGESDYKPEEGYSMIREEIKKVELLGEYGLGVIYWEPQGAFTWSGYGLSCWGEDGKPTKVLSGFK